LGRLGRKASWAAAGPTAGGRGEGGKGRLGHAFSRVYFLDECFHNFNQSK
jgi:hypothetical protein